MKVGARAATLDHARSPPGQMPPSGADSRATPALQPLSPFQHAASGLLGLTRTPDTGGRARVPPGNTAKPPGRAAKPPGIATKPVGHATLPVSAAVQPGGFAVAPGSGMALPGSGGVWPGRGARLERR